jgi:hypothetical protein
MISKFKSLDGEEKALVIIKLVLCFVAGALSAFLIFKLLQL